MPDSLVSVVIPTYNRAYCLPRAIDSVLGQTHPEVDVIVVDDGSKDDTAEMMRARYGGDRRVRYHHQQNKGISGARNTGLGMVIGNYVALLDSDDEWEPWKLELQVGCMRAHPEIGMTWTDMVAVDADGKVLNPAFLRTMYRAYRWYPTTESLFGGGEPIDKLVPRARDVAPRRHVYTGDIGSQMVMGNLVHTSTVVLTRERAAAVKGFSEELRQSGEDFDYHLRTCRLGPVGYLDVSSIRYHIGRSDQASSLSTEMARNFLRTIEPILANERDSIKLPRKMQDIVLAEAHAWLGETLLEKGDDGGARHHLLRSLVIRPGQPRAARLFLGSFLPPPLRTRVRSLYRTVRGMPAR
jgi:glycosyltransferase involved in cell wall biosynthesis